MPADSLSLLLKHADAQSLGTIDAHCHLDKLTFAREYARDAAQAHVELFAMSCTPQIYQANQHRFCNYDHIKLGLGLHPWDVCPDELEAHMAAFMEKLPSTRLVGEVGLDFSPRRVATRSAQLQAFRLIAQACAHEGGKVLSLHAVHATSDVLDILEETGCIHACTCIFHWFSGSSDELNRARKTHCYFSVNERMLESKRGEAYVKALPPQLVLLETDCYPNGAESFGAQHQQLRLVKRRIEALRAQ